MEPYPSAYPHYAPPRRPFAWVTWTLVASTVAVFVLQLVELNRNPLHDDVVGNTLAFSRHALAEHRYYTIVTYAWAHAVAMFGDSGYFWLHIVANMIPLVCLGPALEEMLGHLRYLGLYIGGAIVSVLVWLYFSHVNEPIIGASGAVFAVIAGVGVAAPRARVTVLLFYVVPLRMSMSVVALVACGVEVAFIVAQHIPALAPYSMPDVAHSAHLGGAAFGAFFAWLVLPRR